MPNEEFPPGVLSTDQVTPLLLTFGPLACICSVCDVVSAVSEGLRDNGGTMVTEAAAKTLEFACKIAVTFTVAGLGTPAGAEYVPAEFTVPIVALPPGTLSTCQLTAVLEVFCTLTLNDRF